MIASLYQSGSSGAGDGARSVSAPASVDCRTSVAIDGQHVSLSNFGVEPHVVPFAAPVVDDVVQQVADAEDIVGPDAGDADVAVLHPMRIEVDHGHHPVRAVWRGLAVGDD